MLKATDGPVEECYPKESRQFETHIWAGERSPTKITQIGVEEMETDEIKLKMISDEKIFDINDWKGYFVEYSRAS